MALPSQTTHQRNRLYPLTKGTSSSAGTRKDEFQSDFSLKFGGSTGKDFQMLLAWLAKYQETLVDSEFVPRSKSEESEVLMRQPPR
jgi:hypothetical protein